MRARYVLVVVLFAVALSGCLQVRTLLRVLPDGSGTLTYTLQMRPDAFQQLKALAAMGEDGKGTFELIDEAALKAQAEAYGPGVTFEGVKALDAADGPGFVATYRVADVEALALPVFPDLVLPDGQSPFGDGSEPAPDDERATFAFEPGAEPGAPARLTIRLPDVTEPDVTEPDVTEPDAAAADSLGTDDLDPGDLAMARALFEGLRFSTTVRPAGTLLDTDASFVDGGAVTLLDLDFGDLLANADALQSLTGGPQPSSPAELRALVAEVEGFTMEVEPTVTVVFEGE